IASQYERDAIMPMLICHSQGGLLVSATLHALAGQLGDSTGVRDAQTDAPPPRTTIVDPYTRSERSVSGLQVPYAAAIATGKLPRILLGQWTMLPLLRKIP